MIVTFDIADGSFDFYKDEEWENQLISWREELEADGIDSVLSAEEVVEMTYGDELFFGEVPQIVLDRMLRQPYNRHMKTKNLINQIKAFFSGDKTMAEATRTPNYTDEMVNAMVSDYVDSPSTDTVAKLAQEFNKSTRSIVAKLVREGVYVAKARVTKTGAPVVRKVELVTQIQGYLGIEVPTLEKASKADLELVLSGIEDKMAG